MKAYALAICFFVCTFEAGSAKDLKAATAIEHMKYIMSILHNTLIGIYQDADATGTWNAAGCADDAREEMKNLSDDGYSGVTSCVLSTNYQETANICAQKVAQGVLNKALQVSQFATACMSNFS